MLNIGTLVVHCTTDFGFLESLTADDFGLSNTRKSELC